MDIKPIIILFLCLTSLGCVGNKKTFVADLSLLTTYEQSEKPSKEYSEPYIAIFKKDGKMLVYLASRHYAEQTMNMVDYIYKNFKPQVAVIEFERMGRSLENRCSGNEFEYSAAIASDKNIPVVLSDLKQGDAIKILSGMDKDIFKKFQAMWMIQNKKEYEKQFGGLSTAEKELHNFRVFVWTPYMPEPMAEEEFKELFKQYFGKDFDKTSILNDLGEDIIAPSSKNIFTKVSQDVDYYARDPFMIKNITAALNKYDIVYAAFGEGHYRTHRKVLENMIGKPEYIWNIEQNGKHICGAFKIKQEVLVKDF
jgi:hypothetical protein